MLVPAPLHERLPVGREALDQRDEIRRADDVDAARERVGRERQAHQRRVATVRSAHDRDLVLLREAVVGPLHRVDEIVVHRPCELHVRDVDELLAEAGRAAVVGWQYGVTAIGEPLMRRIEAPDVTRIGTAVDHQHERHSATAGFRCR